MSPSTPLSWLAGAAVLVSVGSALAAGPKKPTFWSGLRKAPAGLPRLEGGWVPEPLQRGDGTAELGLGCSNPTGNSGGPNDWAEKVTADVVTPPFGIISTTYTIYTNNLPNTNWSLVGWATGPTPGAEIFRAVLTPADATEGNHTVAVVPNHGVTTASFYFGFNDQDVNHGMKAGMDTSGSEAGTTFIRAPSCGAASFVDVIGVGFPGYWVFRAIACCGPPPVELMSFDVN